MERAQPANKRNPLLREGGRGEEGHKLPFYYGVKTGRSGHGAKHYRRRVK